MEFLSATGLKGFLQVLLILVVPILKATENLHLPNLESAGCYIL